MYFDEVSVKINGVLNYLWRAVDQDENEIDILVQKRHNRKVAMKFFKKLSKGHQTKPLKIVIDKLRSYSTAKSEIMPSVEQSTQQYENNCCELPQQPGRQQEWQMQRFKLLGQAKRILSCNGSVKDLFRLGQHHMKACNYRLFRERAFAEWSRASCVQNFA